MITAIKMTCEVQQNIKTVHFRQIVYHWLRQAGCLDSRSSWLCEHVSVFFVKLESERKSPVEWTASNSSPSGSTGVFISYLFKPTELDASESVWCHPAQTSDQILAATPGHSGINFCWPGWWIDLQGLSKHLSPPACDVQQSAAPFSPLHRCSRQGRRDALYLRLTGWMLALDTLLLKCFLLWHEAIMTR